MTPFSNLKGQVVEFKIGNIYHPDPPRVHEIWCRELKLQGTCEEIVGDESDGGPYAVVRINEGQDRVFVPTRHLEEVLWGGEPR